jgi:hypothetical protein
MAGRLRDHVPLPARRLLTEVEAAGYCGAPSIVRWRAECPVKGVQVYPGAAGLRYDRAALDAWIDRRTGGVPATDDDPFGRLDDAEAERARGRR